MRMLVAGNWKMNGLAADLRELTVLKDGLAVDPEWKLQPGQHPLGQIGSIYSSELNSVSSWLSDLTARYNLPQKLFVVHQFTEAMVPDRDAVGAPKQLSVVFHMDGLGPPGLKADVYRHLAVDGPKRNGFKVFPTLDKPAMSPAQVMALRPQPEVITYQ